MNNSILVFIFLLLGANAFAQSPLPPIGEFPYSVGVIDRLTRLEIAPSSGHWAFDATISNPNEKAITCRQTKFLVSEP